MVLQAIAYAAYIIEFIIYQKVPVLNSCVYSNDNIGNIGTTYKIMVSCR